MTKKKPKKINTKGGAAVGGDVKVDHGGIFVGRDLGYTAKDVNELLEQIASTFQPKPFDGLCPYLGLDAFSEDDADRFFGRERLVKELLERVTANRFIFITGPSGSGKSSLARAGLIHTLKQGGLPALHSERWLFTTLTPGRNPIEALASAVSQLKSPEVGDYLQQHTKDADALHKCAESALSDRRDQRAVIFVDQFEEVFTQIAKEEERIAFLNLLMRAAMIENGRVTVLLAMRSDFVSNCATYPALSELINQSSQFMLVGAMQPAELVSAIAQPALRVGLKIDPDLIAQIVNDMGDEPGSLPLMQFALRDLFDAQQAAGSVFALMLNDYLARGGLHKALERHAEESFKQLTDSEQQLAGTIFSGLIEPGHGTADTRRTATVEELVPANADRVGVEAVIRKLADARLLTTDQKDHHVAVMLTHETLIDAWPWLRKLVNENREAIALQNQIADDAQDWVQNDHNASYLYTGARLADAREKLAAKKFILGDLAQTFVQASQAQRQRRRAGGVAGVIAIISMLALAAIIFAAQSNENANLAVQNAQIATTVEAANVQISSEVNSRATAESKALEERDKALQQAKLARSRMLGTLAVSYLKDQPELSLLFGVEAYKTQDTYEARNSLLSGIQEYSSVQSFLPSYSRNSTELRLLRNIAFSPDGKTLAVSGKDKIELWDVSAQRISAKILPDKYGNDYITPTGEIFMGFSSSGKELISFEPESGVAIWSVETRRLQKAFVSGTGYDFPQSMDAMSATDLQKRPPPEAASSSPKGPFTNLLHFISAQPGTDIVAVGEPPRVHLLDFVQPSYSGWLSSTGGIVFSSDGTEFATYEGAGIDKVSVWETNTWSKLREVAINTGLTSSALAIDSAEQIIAVGTLSGTIHLWDTETGKSLGDPLIAADGAVGDDRAILDMVFAPDGRTLAASRFNGDIFLWDVIDHKLSRGPFHMHSRGFVRLVLSPDGRSLASVGSEGRIVLWSIAPVSNLGDTLEGSAESINFVATSADGARVAYADSEGNIKVQDFATRRMLLTMAKPHSDLSAVNVALSPDGNLLASSYFDRKYNQLVLRIADLLDKEKQWPIMSVDLGYGAVTFSADGTELRWLTEYGRFGIVNPLQFDGTQSSARLVDIYATVMISGGLPGISMRRSYVADDEIMALTDGHRIAIVRNPVTSKPVISWIAEVPYVGSLAINPQGTLMASAGTDGLYLWDAITLQRIGEPLTTGITEYDSGVAFNSDGKILASKDNDGSVILWDVSARQRLGKPLAMPGLTESNANVVFSGDGKYVVTDSDDGIVRWSADPEAWVALACKIASRNLTQSEWKTYFPDEPYRRTCPQWPEGQ
jgi:WD40 repeat protein/energy-coupling factor transporter ATP-binding protein EcfA2